MIDHVFAKAEGGEARAFPRSKGAGYSLKVEMGSSELELTQSTIVILQRPR